MEHWIWLSRRRGLGSRGQRSLLERFGSPAAVFEAGREALAREGLPQRQVQVLLDRDLTQARAIARRCEALGVRVLTLGDRDYPARLRFLEDAPVVLYCLGVPPTEQAPILGLVGARAADAAGLELALQFGYQIAKCGGQVVTGMAKGIDAASARGALAGGGRVIGVLGCGPEQIYPKENEALFVRILETGGCLLSEYPPGTPPNARHFPVRNRLISALADGVTVVRATESSGSLITARWAREQGRDLFAVPGDPSQALSQGCNLLLRQGAIPALCGWDILCQYEYRYPTAVKEFHGTLAPTAFDSRQPAAGAPACSPGNPPSAVPAPPRPTGGETDCGGQSADRSGKGKSGNRSGNGALPEPTDPAQRAILEILQEGPLQADALIARLDLPAGLVMTQLTLLQVKGYISQAPGKIYTRR